MANTKASSLFSLLYILTLLGQLQVVTGALIRLPPPYVYSGELPPHYKTSAPKDLTARSESVSPSDTYKSPIGLVGRYLNRLEALRNGRNRVNKVNKNPQETNKKKQNYQEQEKQTYKETPNRPEVQPTPVRHPDNRPNNRIQPTPVRHPDNRPNNRIQLTPLPNPRETWKPRVKVTQLEWSNHRKDRKPALPTRIETFIEQLDTTPTPKPKKKVKLEGEPDFPGGGTVDEDISQRSCTRQLPSINEFSEKPDPEIHEYVQSEFLIRGSNDTIQKQMDGLFNYSSAVFTRQQAITMVPGRWGLSPSQSKGPKTTFLVEYGIGANGVFSLAWTNLEVVQETMCSEFESGQPCISKDRGLTGFGIYRLSLFRKFDSEAISIEGTSCRLAGDVSDTPAETKFWVGSLGELDISNKAMTYIRGKVGAVLAQIDSDPIKVVGSINRAVLGVYYDCHLPNAPDKCNEIP